jgi:hypothetical protein
MQAVPDPWPALPLDAWRDTYETLHRWSQMVASAKKRLCPFVDQWWHVALYPTARGLTSGPIPLPEGGVFDIACDFIAHELRIETGSGEQRILQLRPRSVAAFHAELTAMLASLGVWDAVDSTPEEIAEPIPFAQDTSHASYDRAAVDRWWRIMTKAGAAFRRHHSPFIGKASPVQFFTGSFDLSYVRFSGRLIGTGGDAVEQQIGAGFWPGGAEVPGAAFYSNPAPAEPRLTEATVRPRRARYDPQAGYFLLMYDDVRTSESPETAILEFLQSTYEAAANLAQWNRASLERDPLTG